MTNEQKEASANLGKWLSAALDDWRTCEEMKRDIRAWFEAGEPGYVKEKNMTGDWELEVAKQRVSEKLTMAMKHNAVMISPKWLRCLAKFLAAVKSVPTKEYMQTDWWQLVPKDPSEEMEFAFKRTPMGPDRFARAYRAMLAVALSQAEERK